VIELIADGVVTTAHDCSDGGLAVALAEMAIASDCGVTVDAEIPTGLNGRIDEQWFGEAPSRIIIACPEAVIDELMRQCAASVPSIECVKLGTARGDTIALGADVTVSLADARERYEQALTRLS
jgi:phosphoribosylformylglycinamidine synthase